MHKYSPWFFGHITILIRFVQKLTDIGIYAHGKRTD